MGEGREGQEFKVEGVALGNLFITKFTPFLGVLYTSLLSGLKHIRVSPSSDPHHVTPPQKDQERHRNVSNLV